MSLSTPSTKIPTTAQTIGIVGLGLIGGCLAIDLKQLGYTVYGVARRESTATAAMDQGIVTQARCDLNLVSQADVVFICTPMAAIVPTVHRLSQHLPATTIVTDVGSVKGEIVAEATQLWPNFVGGHPMAGKAEAGLDAAEAGLFYQRPYVVTPISTTQMSSVAQVVEIATKLGSRIYTASPQTHDQAVAAISHLPVMVSASLLHTCLAETDPQVKPLAQQLASSGFCDTSRVGGGNPELGRMMAEYNRPALLQALKQYQYQLDSIITLVEAEQWEALEARLTMAHDERPHYL